VLDAVELGQCYITINGRNSSAGSLLAVFKGVKSRDVVWVGHATEPTHRIGVLARPSRRSPASYHTNANEAHGTLAALLTLHHCYDFYYTYLSNWITVLENTGTVHVNAEELNMGSSPSVSALGTTAFCSSTVL
jgi:hypothetical protein